MIVQVEMRAFHKTTDGQWDGTVRLVEIEGEIADHEYRNYGVDYTEILEEVFRLGQNDFQAARGFKPASKDLDDPRVPEHARDRKFWTEETNRICSVSVGDVILLDGKRFRVESLGFSEVLP